MLNAWATEEGVALGQRKVNGKSNEITEIPEILKELSIKGRIFTIDAAGAQKNIAEIIIDGEGDYILGLKGNQKTLHNEACNYFSQALELYDQSREKGLETTTEMDSIGINVHTSESVSFLIACVTTGSIFLHDGTFLLIIERKHLCMPIYLSILTQ